ncbi:MAG: Lrp/AsnC family transcriptional regulator [Streptosporangiaceae bacterium]
MSSEADTEVRQALEPPVPIAASGSTVDPGVDSVDLALLRLLAEDARWSRRRLAREVGMSAPAVGERIARLEASGVIRGYRAEIDWGALGLPMVVYLSVVCVQGRDQTEVVRALRALPEVQDVQIVTGRMDLIVRLRLRDHAHLRETLFDHVWKIQGIERTETLISLASMRLKDFAAGLIDDLLSPGVRER